MNQNLDGVVLIIALVTLTGKKKTPLWVFFFLPYRTSPLKKEVAASEGRNQRGGICRSIGMNDMNKSIANQE